MGLKLNFGQFTSTSEVNCSGSSIPYRPVPVPLLVFCAQVLMAQEHATVAMDEIICHSQQPWQCLCFLFSFLPLLFNRVEAASEETLP